LGLNSFPAQWFLTGMRASPERIPINFHEGRELLKVYQSIHLFLELIENEGGLKQTPSTCGRRDKKNVRNHCSSTIDWRVFELQRLGQYEKIHTF